jgi:acetyl-CoA carboxylase carboxyl transferase subunit beta
MEFSFIGGSMGSVVGEKITRAIERATERRLPAIVFAASGGARMHEGMFSLMQMAKTSGALQRHAAAKLPFISVLTHPTMGGVTASFATLGDIIIAEPKAMIGFAGARVLKETTRQDLPKGFQTAEFLLERGLVDCIISRTNMRAELGKLLSYLGHSSHRHTAGRNGHASPAERNGHEAAYRNGHDHVASPLS